MHLHPINKNIILLADVTDWTTLPAGRGSIPFILLVSVCKNLGSFRVHKETLVICRTFSSSCPILHLMCFDKHILSSLPRVLSFSHFSDNDVQESWNRPWKWPLAHSLQSVVLPFLLFPLLRVESFMLLCTFGMTAACRTKVAATIQGGAQTPWHSVVFFAVFLSFANDSGTKDLNNVSL